MLFSKKWNCWKNAGRTGSRRSKAQSRPIIPTIPLQEQSYKKGFKNTYSSEDNLDPVVLSGFGTQRRIRVVWQVLREK